MRAVTTDNGSASVRYVGRTGDDRAIYRWAITDATGSILATGDDLHSGVGAKVSLHEALDSLGSFLSAYAEAVECDGENADLFPSSVPADLASELSDTIHLSLHTWWES